MSQLCALVKAYRFGLVPVGGPPTWVAARYGLLVEQAWMTARQPQYVPRRRMQSSTNARKKHGCEHAEGEYHRA
jgi:hypothetical protein